MVVRLVLLAVVSCCLFTTGIGCAAQGADGAVNSCVDCHSERLSSAVCGSLSPSGEPKDCTWCHRGNVLTRRKALAHDHLIGKAYASYRLPAEYYPDNGVNWVEIFACRRCHVHNKQGNQLATDLDQLLSRSRIEDIEHALADPAYYMPFFALNTGMVHSVITQILRGGTTYRATAELPPKVVHFTDDLNDSNLFVKHCGACHRILSQRHGGLGVGVQGPNLSGLLTPFYPHTFGDNQPWTVDALKKWLDNPRKIRPLTTMPPVVLQTEEKLQLIEYTWRQ